MKLLALMLKGFRSFTTEQVLDLREVPTGLYSVAGTNGAGKSSLFESLHWTLFGETSRGLRASHVNAWSVGKGCECAALFEGLEIERGWGPNYLRVNGEDADQKRVYEVLQLTPEAALHAYFFCQFSTFFLDLKPPERMDIYSAVLGLETWNEKADQARKLAQEQTGVLQAMQLEIERKRAKAEALRATNFAAEIKAWNAKYKAQQEKRVQEAHALAQQLEETQERSEAWGREISKLRTKVEAEERRLEKEQEARAQSYALVEAAKERLRAAKEAELEAQRDLDLFGSQEEGPCSLCGQKVTVEHRTQHLETLKKAYASRVNSTRAAERAVEKARAAVLESPSKDKLATLREQHREAHAERKGAEIYLEELGRTAQTLTEEYEEGQRETNPFALRKKAAETEAAKLEEDAAALEAESAELQGLQATFEFWAKGFKDIRFQVMQESLMQLNVEVNECLHDIGLPEWEIRFDVERETKKGTVRRGFLCSVLAPGAPETVPWEAWSGGETQRLRIAAQLGISNMIRARTGVSPDFEFWDEPTGWLNEAGIKDVLSILQERAERYSRRIFLADHRALDFDFDGALTITKKENGSELFPSWVP